MLGCLGSTYTFLSPNEPFLRSKYGMATLRPSRRPGKKWAVTLPDGRTVHFGATGYSDYALHKDEARRDRYLARHARGRRENWGASGIDTPGFWARWLLWNKPSLKASVVDVRRRFGLPVVVRRS